jgi:hypothetical protein
MSKDLEMMAEMMGEDIDQIKRNPTEMSPEELEEKTEGHFENLLGGKPRSMFDSRYDRGESSTINSSTYKQREISIEQFVEWYENSPHDTLQSQTFRSFLNDMLQDEGYGSETMKTRYWQLVSWFKSDLFKDTIEAEIRDVEHMDLINKYSTVVILRPCSTVPSAHAVVAPGGNRRTQFCQTVVDTTKTSFYPDFVQLPYPEVQKNNLLMVSKGISRSILICVTASFNSKTEYVLSADVALLTSGVGRESTADQLVGVHSSTISTPVISYRTPLCSS